MTRSKQILTLLVSLAALAALAPAASAATTPNPRVSAEPKAVRYNSVAPSGLYRGGSIEPSGIYRGSLEPNPVRWGALKPNPRVGSLPKRIIRIQVSRFSG